MNEKRSEQAVVTSHHLEALLEGSLMILHRHATIQVVVDDGIDIAQRQMATSCLSHDADAPIDIRRETIVEIVVDAFGYVGTSIERLMTNQHTPHKAAPRETFRRSQTTMAQEMTIHIHDVGIAIEHARQLLSLADTPLHKLQGIFGREDIACIQEYQIVARSTVDTLVHSIIKSFVWL